jgi:3-hydroxyisobutyrate dehydrogenase
MTKIAFVGLGNMGGPMAVNLAKAGHDVTAFDLSQDALAKAKENGIRPAATVAEAVKQAEAVVTMLPAGRHVMAVYDGEDGVLANCPNGAILMDCSTIDVDSARKVNALAADKGFIMVDAPVSGGVGGAAAGTLTFMVGGTDDAFAAAKPFLDIMGKAVIHAGGAGTGQAAKICNNMLLGISMAATSETFMLAEKLGLDAQKLFDISSVSSGQNWSMTSYCPVPGPVPTSPANRDYEPGFAAAMMLKDLRLAQEAAQTSGAATPFGSLAESLYTLYCNSGAGNKDFSGIVKMLGGKQD